VEAINDGMKEAARRMRSPNSLVRGFVETIEGAETSDATWVATPVSANQHAPHDAVREKPSIKY